MSLALQRFSNPLSAHLKFFGHTILSRISSILFLSSSFINAMPPRCLPLIPNRGGTISRVSYQTNQSWSCRCFYFRIPGNWLVKIPAISSRFQDVLKLKILVWNIHSKTLHVRACIMARTQHFVWPLKIVILFHYRGIIVLILSVCSISSLYNQLKNHWLTNGIIIALNINRLLYYDVYLSRWRNQKHPRFIATLIIESIL